MFSNKKKKVQFAQELDYFVLGKLTGVNLILQGSNKEGISEEERKEYIERCIKLNNEISSYLRERYKDELDLNMKNTLLPSHKRIKIDLKTLNSESMIKLNSSK
ncbi:hypothetical protein [Tenacibaculum sp. 190524A05c]|uniref:hypothetical protein n=1 Tax=Tenacibaculum platacis TaxID=3137852 RepID=UPI0031FAF144